MLTPNFTTDCHATKSKRYMRLRINNAEDELSRSSSKKWKLLRPSPFPLQEHSRVISRADLGYQYNLFVSNLVILRMSFNAMSIMPHSLQCEISQYRIG